MYKMFYIIWLTFLKKINNTEWKSVIYESEDKKIKSTLNVKNLHLKWDDLPHSFSKEYVMFTNLLKLRQF